MVKCILKCLVVFFVLTLNTQAQNFIKISATHDFKKDKFIQTFAVDFNRTESMSEKQGAALYQSIWKGKYWYVVPTSDINIGDGITSSENNVLAQAVLGISQLGLPITSTKDASVKYFHNYSLELNPSYNSDKLFEEKLVYLQPKFIYNLISTKGNAAPVYVRSVHSLSLGAFTNVGYRFTKVYPSDNEYINAGVLLDYKNRIADASSDVCIIKVSGSYYHIISDIKELIRDDFAGVVKASVDTRLYSKAYIGLSYKYGNDNPKYIYINTLEASLKIKY